MDSHAWAVGLFAYAGVTDLLDGWIARKWNRQTVVGTVIDPMADKALMTILTICLAAKGALPCMCFHRLKQARDMGWI
jgi:cardiolipin synthase